jgi:flagellar hook-basal body complex protein FliE
MTFLTPAEVHGDHFMLARTHSGHFAGKHETPSGSQPGEFGSMLFRSLDQVNALQNRHEALSVQAIIDPDSVNPHDITIAAAQAELALNITKNVVDRVVRAYRDITTAR